MKNLNPTSPAPWSESLQTQTRKAIDDLSIGPDGRLHFKHKSLGYAFAEVTDLIDVLKLTCKKTSAEYSFSSCDDLIEAGWAID